VCGAFLVIAAGKWLARKAEAKILHITDLADDRNKQP
jgi:hypothetical protein